jgi:hypothetical protein
MSRPRDGRNRKDLDQALVYLDLIGVMLRAQTQARAQACTALFAPFDPFWPDRSRRGADQTSSTMPSRANSQSTVRAPGPPRLS